MAQHLPSVIWPLRRDLQSGYVRTVDKKRISLCFQLQNDPGHVTEIHLTRADARLWVKRINQCLDSTKER